MAYQIWSIDGHTVELEHGWWSGTATVIVDGESVFKKPSPPLYLDYGFVHRFEIDGELCAVRVICQVYKFRYEFLTGEDAERIVEANRLPLDLPLGQLAIYFGGMIVSAIILILITVFLTRQ